MVLVLALLMMAVPQMKVAVVFAVLRVVVCFVGLRSHLKIAEVAVAGLTASAVGAAVAGAIVVEMVEAGKTVAAFATRSSGVACRAVSRQTRPEAEGAWRQA